MYIARRKNDESKKRTTIRYLFFTAKGWKNLKLFIILNDQQQHPSMMKNNVTTEKFPSGFTKPDKPHNIRIPCFLTLTGKRNKAKKKKKRRTRRKERVYVAQQCLSSPIVSSFSLSPFPPFSLQNTPFAKCDYDSPDKKNGDAFARDIWNSSTRRIVSPFLPSPPLAISS